MAAPLRTAVIGLGLAGRTFHVPHLAASSDFEITVLCQRSSALGADFAVLAPRARVVHDALEAARAPDVDLVVVATPDRTHFEIAAAALRAGKHVLVDKPLTSTLQQAAELFAIARECGGKLACMPYQNRRYCSDFATVRSLLEARRLGELVEFESHYDRFRPEVRQLWKELDRGALDNLGPHVIDQALLLFGEPTRVCADERALPPRAVTDDAFELQLFYDGAAPGRITGTCAPPRWRCVLKSTMLAPANELKFVLHGSEASFVKSGLDGQEAALGAGGPVLPADGENWAVEPATFAGVLTSGRSGAAETVPSVYTSYVRFYSAFAAALRAPEPLRAQEVSPEMALLLLRVIETARRSSASGRVEPLVPVPDI